MTDTVAEKITPQSLGLTPYHIDNLETLQRFLANEASPPPKFDMRYYMAAPGRDGFLMSYSEVPTTPKEIERYNDCGTCACAVGHGPLAGIPAVDGEGWSGYSERVFGLSSMSLFNTTAYKAWDFLFGPDWEGRDNTAIGAAARIRWFLAGDLGIDPTWKYQRGDAEKSWHNAPVAA